MNYEEIVQYLNTMIGSAIADGGMACLPEDALLDILEFIRHLQAEHNALGIRAAKLDSQVYELQQQLKEKKNQ